MTEFAKLSGCSEEEIMEAVQAASNVARDSVYFAGIDYDAEQFKEELRQFVQHAQASQQQAA